MKTRNFLLLFIAAVPLLFSSCVKDDAATADAKAQLEGTWRYTSVTYTRAGSPTVYTVTDNYDQYKLQFNEDGTASRRNTINGELEEGKWYLENMTLTGSSENTSTSFQKLNLYLNKELTGYSVEEEWQSVNISASRLTARYANGERTFSYTLTRE
jgi:hypothetical protein